MIIRDPGLFIDVKTWAGESNVSASLYLSLLFLTLLIFIWSGLSPYFAVNLLKLGEGRKSNSIDLSYSLIFITLTKKARQLSKA